MKFFLNILFSNDSLSHYNGQRGSQQPRNSVISLCTSGGSGSQTLMAEPIQNLLNAVPVIIKMAPL